MNTNLSAANGGLPPACALGAPFFIAPEAAAERVVALATRPEFGGVTGKFFVRGREVVPKAKARDAAAAERLWEISESRTRPA